MVVGSYALDFDFENLTKIVAYDEEKIRNVNWSHSPIDLFGIQH